MNSFNQALSDTQGLVTKRYDVTLLVSLGRIFAPVRTLCHGTQVIARSDQFLMDPTTQNILRECADRLIQTADLIARSSPAASSTTASTAAPASPLPPRQQHPLFSPTRLLLLYQRPGRNMPVCSAINRQQETCAVDLIMEEGSREPIVRICHTTEDRRGQEPLFALRPRLQPNCQLQPRE